MFSKKLTSFRQKVHVWGQLETTLFVVFATITHNRRLEIVNNQYASCNSGKALDCLDVVNLDICVCSTHGSRYVWA